MTPFKALYGPPPLTIAWYIKGTIGTPLVDEYMLDRDALLACLNQNLSKAQTRMKFTADKHHRDLVFNEGDRVYVRLQPFYQNSVRLPRHHKLRRLLSLMSITKGNIHIVLIS